MWRVSSQEHDIMSDGGCFLVFKPPVLWLWNLRPNQRKKARPRSSVIFFLILRFMRGLNLKISYDDKNNVNAHPGEVSFACEFSLSYFNVLQF